MVSHRPCKPGGALPTGRAPSWPGGHSFSTGADGGATEVCGAEEHQMSDDAETTKDETQRRPLPVRSEHRYTLFQRVAPSRLHDLGLTDPGDREVLYTMMTFFDWSTPLERMDAWPGYRTLATCAACSVGKAYSAIA